MGGGPVAFLLSRSVILSIWREVAGRDNSCGRIGLTVKIRRILGSRKDNANDVGGCGSFLLNRARWTCWTPRPDLHLLALQCESTSFFGMVPGSNPKKFSTLKNNVNLIVLITLI